MGAATRQQRRAAARRFVRCHRRDPAYLHWVLRSAGASSALVVALLGLAAPAGAALPAFGGFIPDPLAGQGAGHDLTPALADLDGDGDLDVVSGENGGGLRYFENTGGLTSAAFAPRTGAANPFDGFAAGTRSAPSLGDLDGDGDVDVLVGDYAGTFVYFENTGSGTIPAFVPRTGAQNPLDGVDVGKRSAPALGDLDGDGDLDLVVGEYEGLFHYFENTGTATSPAFAARTGAANPLDGFDIVFASTPALGDFDRDGDLDLVAGQSDGTFLVFENTGTRVSPSFVARTGAANPLSGQDVGHRSAPTLGDLDGDGDLDLVAGSAAFFWTFENLRSPGAIPSFAGNLVYHPALGDLDGDGDLDLVAAGSKYFHYFEDTGTAAEPAFVQRTGAANPFDGLPIDPPPGGFSGDSCGAPALVDLDGDGDLDLVAGSGFSDTGSARDLFCYFENTGTAARPAFVQRTETANPLANLQARGPYLLTPAFGDLDGDGDLDLVTGGFSNMQIRYFQNTGSSTHPAFVERTGAANPILYGYYRTTPSLGDLDGDGDLDLVVGSDLGLAYLENTGSPTTPAYVERAGARNPFYPFHSGVVQLPEPALGDLDGDGDLDLVENRYAGEFRMFENTGGPQNPAFALQPPADPISGLEPAYGLVSGPAAFPDLDHDGDPDLVIVSSSASRLFENTGDAIAPSFVERTGAANPLPNVHNLHVSAPTFADLDGDGDLDLLVGTTTGMQYYPAGPFYYFENTGDATVPKFAAGVQNPFGLSTDSGIYSAPSPCFADLDGDGDFDIVARNGTVAYYENTGTRTRPAFVRRTGSANPFDAIIFGRFIYPTTVALADFDLDGDLDLIVGGEFDFPHPGFAYFRNTGSATAPAFERLTAPLRDPLDGQEGFHYGPAPAAVDLDGDGDFDFVDAAKFVYYAPEPGRGLLFAAGAVLLNLLGRWRRRPYEGRNRAISARSSSSGASRNSRL